MPHADGLLASSVRIGVAYSSVTVGEVGLLTLAVQNTGGDLLRRVSFRIVFPTATRRLGGTDVCDLRRLPPHTTHVLALRVLVPSPGSTSVQIVGLTWRDPAGRVCRGRDYRLHFNVERPQHSRSQIQTLPSEAPACSVAAVPRRAPPALDRDKAKVLFLAADPSEDAHLRLDRELRDIRAGLRDAGGATWLTLEPRLAVRRSELGLLLLTERPYIVHFSGHGSSDGCLVLEGDSGSGEIVPRNALADLFALMRESVECVVLNACYSEPQARLLARHVRYVVGMRRLIDDDAATRFAVGFYQAIAARYNVEQAYAAGCAEVRLLGRRAASIPVLRQRFATRRAKARHSTAAVPKPPSFSDVQGISSASPVAAGDGDGDDDA